MHYVRITHYENSKNATSISGLSGAFLKEPPGPKFCNWYNGPCLLEFLDGLPAVDRMGADKPLRMPIIDR